PQLHLVIKDALELRQHMMLNKINREVNKALKGENYSDSELVSEDKIDSELEAELRETEHLIRFYFESSKELKQLPHDWEYDPETASTFVSAEADILTFRTTTRKERRALLRNKIIRLKGKNYTQLRKDLYKNDSESESDNNPDVKNLLKDKNDKELMKDLEYKNDSESEPVSTRLESPSAVLGKRKGTDLATASIFVAATADNSALQKLPPPTHESGDATSKIIPRQLHRLIQKALKQRERVMRNKLQRKLKKALKGKNYSESESVSEDKNDSESELYNHLDVQMEQCEDRVRLLAKKFKKLKQLPHDW
ncbi:hypothetical protein Tco_1527595, partial [Tanacetum coccineum]